MASIEEIDDITPFRSIFVFTHDIGRFYEKFNRYVKGKIILSHNSDDEIMVIHNDISLHLGMNCIARKERLIGVPIGIENLQWVQHDIFHRIRKMKIPKTKDVYFYFNIHTHPTRITCYNALKDILQWNTHKSKEEYFIELAKHKYCICPRGNGIDTHRLWECIYLDVIPIVIQDDFLNIDNLPIIVIDKWSSFPMKHMNECFGEQKGEKLTVQYYADLINKASNSL